MKARFRCNRQHIRGCQRTDNGQCGADFGREQGDAEGAILKEACPEAATLLQAKRCHAMAFGNSRIASKGCRGQCDNRLQPTQRRHSFPG